MACFPAMNHVTRPTAVSLLPARVGNVMLMSFCCQRQVITDDKARINLLNMLRNGNCNRAAHASVMRRRAPFFGRNCRYRVADWDGLLAVHSTPSWPTSLTRPSEVDTYGNTDGMEADPVQTACAVQWQTHRKYALYRFISKAVCCCWKASMTEKLRRDRRQYQLVFSEREPFRFQQLLMQFLLESALHALADL